MGIGPGFESRLLYFLPLFTRVRVARPTASLSAVSLRDVAIGPLLAAVGGVLSIFVTLSLPKCARRVVPGKSFCVSDAVGLDSLLKNSFALSSAPGSGAEYAVSVVFRPCFWTLLDRRPGRRLLFHQAVDFSH
jgi:hypothetical protein